MSDKKTLRAQLRQARRAIPPEARQAAAEALSRLAKTHGLLRRHGRIGFYLSFDGEMDLLPLMNAGLWLGRRCYLPVVPHRSRRTLRFSLVTDRPSWYLNRFGIHEHDSHEVIPVRNLDLLFVPLVGFDAAGNRLGMGGGFYDTTLAYLRRRCHWRKPRIVGVGFECQKVERLPHDPWDFRLDAVLTEERLYQFRRGLTCVTG